MNNIQFGEKTFKELTLSPRMLRMMGGIPQMPVIVS
jgi:hypothetical protein